VCIIDKAGKVIREVKVATEPVAILAVLTEEELAIERIGLEAGPLSQWLIFAAGDRTAWLTMQSGANQSPAKFP
jgi:transposase